ncbi:FG-GAP-like repeat-containing protein [Myxococcota bacterium]
MLHLFATGLCLSISTGAIQIDSSPLWESEHNYRAGGVALGDANGDGIFDLAVGNYGGGWPELPLNTVIFLGNGTTLETTPSWTGELEGHTTAVGWARIGGGNSPDLIEINGGASGHQSLVYGYDQGSLDTYPRWASVGTGHSGLGFAVGDVNRDGVLDLFIANQNYFEDAQSIGFVSTAGTLPEAANWFSANVGQFSDAALGDLDRSGVMERTYLASGDGATHLFWLPELSLAMHRVLVAGANPGPVTCDPVAGTVYFRVPPPAGAAIEILYEISTELDLAVSGDPGGVLLYLHDAGIPTSPDRTLDQEAANKRVMLVDLDRDGFQEIVAAGGNNSPLAVFDNDNGTILATPTWVSEAASLDAVDAAVADIDADGFADVIVGIFCGDVHVYQNLAGTLEATPSVTIATEDGCVSSLSAGDANIDGMVDLLLGHAGERTTIHANAQSPWPAPVVDSFSQASTTLTVSGHDFRGPVRVYIDNDRQVQAVTSVTATTIVATLPDASTATRVVVVNPDLQAAISGAAPADGGPTDAGPSDGGTTDGGIIGDGGPSDQDGPVGGDSRYMPPPRIDDSDDGCACGGGKSSFAAIFVALCVLPTLRLKRKRAN